MKSLLSVFVSILVGATATQYDFQFADSRRPPVSYVPGYFPPVQQLTGRTIPYSYAESPESYTRTTNYYGGSNSAYIPAIYQGNAINRVSTVNYPFPLTSQNVLTIPGNPISQLQTVDYPFSTTSQNVLTTPGNSISQLQSVDYPFSSTTQNVLTTPGNTISQLQTADYPISTGTLLTTPSNYLSTLNYPISLGSQNFPATFNNLPTTNTLSRFQGSGITRYQTTPVYTAPVTTTIERSAFYPRLSQNQIHRPNLRFDSQYNVPVYRNFVPRS